MDKTSAILVTGATGFLGSYVVRQLLSAGYRNITCLRRSTSSLALLGPAAAQVQWVEGDLQDTYQLHETLQEIDVVVHAAALVSLRKRDHDRMMKINVEGTANVINASLEGGVRRLVHVSSIAALGRSANTANIDEQTEWVNDKRNTSYAVSKYKAELEVWRGWREGLNVIVLNPSVILGSGFWDLGTCRMFRQVARGLRFYPNGSTGFVDVRDVASAVVSSIESDITGQRMVISGAHCSWQDLFGLIAQGLDKRPPHIRMTPPLTHLAVWGSWVLAQLTRRPHLLTAGAMHNLGGDYHYDNRASIEALGSTYRPLRDTIRDTCKQALEAAQNGWEPNYLPLISPNE